MKKIITLSFLLIFISALYADNKSTYEKLLKENKLIELEQHLLLWEKEDPKNPEMFIAYFNYYLQKGRHSTASIDSNNINTEDELERTYAVASEILAYANARFVYEKENLDNALKYIRKGIQITPNRLDMHFEQIHILYEVEDYSLMADKLIEVLEISKKLNNKWLWINGVSIAENEAEEFFFDLINDYYYEVAKVKNAGTYNAVERVSKHQIRLYPNIIYGYNALGALKMRQTHYEEALKYFQQAEKIDKEDIISMSFIANCYVSLNDKKKAWEYFIRIEKKGNAEEKEYARKKLEQLEGK